MATRRLTKWAGLRASHHYRSLLVNAPRPAISPATAGTFFFHSSSSHSGMIGGGGGGLSKSSLTRCYSSSSHNIVSTFLSNTGDDSEYSYMAMKIIVDAFEAVRASKQEKLETEHLMKALLEHKDGLARKILIKAGVNHTIVLQATNDFINQEPMPRVSLILRLIGEINPSLGAHMCLLLYNAQSYKKEMGDSVLSVGHLLLAFHKDMRFGHKLFMKLDINEEVLKNSVKAVCGSQTVNDLKDSVKDVNGSQNVTYSKDSAKAEVKQVTYESVEDMILAYLKSNNELMDYLKTIYGSEAVHNWQNSVENKVNGSQEVTEESKFDKIKKNHSS